MVHVFSRFCKGIGVGHHGHEEAGESLVRVSGQPRHGKCGTIQIRVTPPPALALAWEAGTSPRTPRPSQGASPKSVSAAARRYAFKKQFCLLPLNANLVLGRPQRPWGRPHENGLRYAFWSAAIKEAAVAIRWLLR